MSSTGFFFYIFINIIYNLHDFILCTTESNLHDPVYDHIII